jgi:hypothetical protein
MLTSLGNRGREPDDAGLHRHDQRQGRLAILGDMILRATASVALTELVKCLRRRHRAGGRGGDRRPSVSRRRFDVVVVGGGSAAAWSPG